MTTQPTITFNDGKSIPQVGLGVWQTPENVAPMAVSTALKAGYRHVDTAAIYENEDGVGEGMRQSGVARKDIFLTTKLWNEAQGFDSTLKAFDQSLKRLGTDYIDLYQLHAFDAMTPLEETLGTLDDLVRAGKIRYIG